MGAVRAEKSALPHLQTLSISFPSRTKQCGRRLATRKCWAGEGEEERQVQSKRPPDSDLARTDFLRQMWNNTGFPRKVHQALNPPFRKRLKSTISVETCYHLLTPSENLPTTYPWHRQPSEALFYRIDTLMNAMLEKTWVQFLNPNTPKTFPKHPKPKIT